MCFSTGYFYPLYLAVGSWVPSYVGTEEGEAAQLGWLWEKPGCREARGLRGESHVDRLLSSSL